MRAVVITGVSSGIGLAAAAAFTRRRVHVFGSVRRESDAERVTTACEGNFSPLFFDVTDENLISRAVQQVRDRIGNEPLFGLVNNAGIAVPGATVDLSIAEFRHQLEVNLVGAFAVTKGFLPLLTANHSRQGRPGRIVNISSVGGSRGLPFMGAYVASKHALEGWSECLRRELMPFGIDVIVVSSGSVNTPIWDKAQAVDLVRYESSYYRAALDKFCDQMLRYGRRGYPPERIADIVWTALNARRPRTRYVVVRRRLINWSLPALLPSRVADRLIARVLGLRQSPSAKRTI